MNDTVNVNAIASPSPSGADEGAQVHSTSHHGGDWGPVRAGVAALVRWSPLIVGVGLLVALAVIAIDEVAGNDPEAVARLGVTQDVDWPFFDVVREEAFAAADSPEVRAAVEAELGGQLVDYRVERPEGLLLVDVVVVATDPDAAVRGADLAGRTVVENDVSARLAAIDSEAATLTGQLDEVDELIIQLDAEIAETLAQYDGATGGETIALDGEISTLSAQRAVAVQDAVNLENRIAQLDRDRGLVTPQVDVTGLSTPADEDDSNLTVALATGLGAALVAAIVVVVTARERGRIRSRLQVASGLDVPVVAVDSGTAVSSDVVRVLHRAHRDGHDVVAVDTAPGASTSLRAMTAAARAEGGDLTLVDLTGADPTTSGLCTAAVVVARRHRSSMGWLRRRVAAHQDSGLDVLAVLVT